MHEHPRQPHGILEIWCQTCGLLVASIPDTVPDLNVASLAAREGHAAAVHGVTEAQLIAARLRAPQHDLETAGRARIAAHWAQDHGEDELRAADRHQ